MIHRIIPAKLFWTVLFLRFAFLAMAAPVTNRVQLAWDNNPEPDIGGYIIYAGNESRDYTLAQPVENITNRVINGVSGDILIPHHNTTRQWYFAVTATNTAGLESEYSNEVSTNFPAIPPGAPTGLRTIKILIDIQIQQ